MALLCCLWGSKAFTQAPPNDLCANAIDLVCGTTIAGTVTNATPTPNYQALNDVWYRVSNISGSATVSLCGTSTSFDSWIRVFKPTSSNPACQPGMTLVAQNHDFCGDLSEVTWPAVAGEVYYIQVNDWGYSIGPNGQPILPYGPFKITTTCTSSAPANDDCANDITVQCGSTTAGTTVGANTDLGFASPGLWYRVIGTGFPVEVSLCGLSNYANDIHVYEGACPNSSTPEIGVKTTCNGTSQKVTFPTINGVYYRVLVNGDGTASGNFELAVNCPIPTPPNDLCINAIPVACNSVTPGTTIAATGAAQNGPDVWYSFVGTGYLVTASLCGSGNYDSWMQVQELSGANCSSTITNSWVNDDACGQDAEVTFMSQLGVTYLIRVAGYDWNDFGNFTLTITCDTDNIPNNDGCPGAYPIACGGEYLGSTSNSTPDPINPNNPFSPTTNGVWYVLKGTGQPFTFSTCGSNAYDSYIYLYEGEDCNNKSLVASDDDGCNATCRWSLSSILTYPTIAGKRYYLLVGGYGAATGNFMLKVTSPGCQSKPVVECGKETGKTDVTILSKEKASFVVKSAPNPSTDHVDFQVMVSQPGTAQLRIMDLTGQVVAVRNLGELEEGQHTVRHDWQGVAAGVYLYEFRVGEAQQTGKLQVLR